MDVFVSLIALGPSGEANADSSQFARGNFSAWNHFPSFFGSGMVNYTDWEQYENVTTYKVFAKESLHSCRTSVQECDIEIGDNNNCLVANEIL